MAIEQSSLERKLESSRLCSELKRLDANYFALFEKVRDWANAQWKDHMDVVEQVRHGEIHAMMLHYYADIVLENWLSKGKIPAQDLFLILSSIYLHDIGMQVGWKKALNIGGDRGNLTKEE
jgi:hypothetical protein